MLNSETMPVKQKYGRMAPSSSHLNCYGQKTIGCKTKLCCRASINLICCAFCLPKGITLAVSRTCRNLTAVKEGRGEVGEEGGKGEGGGCIRMAMFKSAAACPAKPFPKTDTELSLAPGGPEGRGTIGTLLKLLNAGINKSVAAKGTGGRGPSKQRTSDNAAGDSDMDEPDEDTAGATAAGKGRGGASQAGGGRRRGGPRPLCRPVIAICNDLYAPVLRPLRNVAHVVPFKTPSVRWPWTYWGFRSASIHYLCVPP
jgi:hypothetical protein